jgi:hypothetical protein
LQIRRIAGQRHTSGTLRTRNISSSGVYFLVPYELEPGTPVELDLFLAKRHDRGSVVMSTQAHVVRCEPSLATGFRGCGAEFDDIAFALRSQSFLDSE